MSSYDVASEIYLALVAGREATEYDLDTFPKERRMRLHILHDNGGIEAVGGAAYSHRVRRCRLTPVFVRKHEKIRLSLWVSDSMPVCDSL
jgi:hypothetical protein